MSIPLGNCNILLPLTTPFARMWGTEVTARSPEVIRRVHLHFAFSDMTAHYRGAPDGGLLEGAGQPDDGTDCALAWCYLDHDQRVPITGGFDVRLPWSAWFSNYVVYGSGVLAGEGPNHLPSHTSADVEFGKTLGERPCADYF